MENDNVFEEFLENLSDDEKNNDVDDYGDEFDSFEDENSYQTTANTSNNNTTQLIPLSTDIQNSDAEVEIPRGTSIVIPKKPEKRPTKEESSDERIYRIEEFIAHTVPGRPVKIAVKSKPQQRDIGLHESSSAPAIESRHARHSVNESVTKSKRSAIVGAVPSHLSSYVDNLKDEIAALHEFVQQLQSELKASDLQLSNCKKSNRKLHAKLEHMGQLSDDFSQLQETCEVMKFRETALLEAVEELTTQNQDLIAKLKVSMQRELELSSTKAAAVSQSVLHQFQQPPIRKIATKQKSEVNPSAIFAYGTPQQQQQMLRPPHDDRSQRRIRSDGSIIQDTKSQPQRRTCDNH